MIYEAFPYYQSKTDNHLKIRFKKIQHNLILKERKVKTRKRGEEVLDEFDELKVDEGQWFRPFDDISGYRGVSYYLAIKFYLYTYQNFGLTF